VQCRGELYRAAFQLIKAGPAGVARGGTGPWRAGGRRSSSSMHALSPEVWQLGLVSPAARWDQWREPRRTGDAPQCICADTTTSLRWTGFAMHLAAVRFCESS
jgi:hypothetical protein